LKLNKSMARRRTVAPLFVSPDPLVGVSVNHFLEDTVEAASVFKSIAVPIVAMCHIYFEHEETGVAMA